MNSKRRRRIEKQDHLLVVQVDNVLGNTEEGPVLGQLVPRELSLCSHQLGWQVCQRKC